MDKEVWKSFGKLSSQDRKTIIEKIKRVNSYSNSQIFDKLNELFLTYKDWNKIKEL